MKMKWYLILTLLAIPMISIAHTEICVHDESMKQVELVEGDKNSPCLVVYEGKMLWKFRKDLKKCGEKMDLLILKLEKEGYLCFSADSQKN